MDRTKLQKMLIVHEGLRQKIYRCPAGKLTIGVRRNLEDNGISENEAMYMLRNDIHICTSDVLNIFENFESLSEARQHVLIDMRFNLGPSTFRQFKRLIRAVNNSEFEKAAKAMKNSKWYNQVGERSRVLVRMMLENRSFV